MPCIDPISIEICPLAIRWYALAYIAGLLLGWRFCVMLTARPPEVISREKLDDLLFYATLGVILGGRMADFLLERFPNGRVMVILFGLVVSIPPVVVAYTTDSLPVFYIASFLAQMISASALGAAAASSQALVLPRMRGMATAIFFLSTTLIGLGIGPFLAGYVSAVSEGGLSTGMLTTLSVAPIGLVMLLLALKLVPAAGSSVVERAREAGEAV